MVVRYLLEMVFLCDVQAFNNAIDSGSTEVVQMFLDIDPTVVAYVGSHNKTCLDVAFNGYIPREKTVPMIRLLMAHGADPNRPTPLMWKAISSSYPEAVEELERHGARPSKVNFLSTAVRGGSIEMVRHLVDGGAPLNPSAGEESEWTVLHQAVRLGKDDIVAFLLERGADPTIRDDQLHQTPLETTEANGRPTAADLLRNALKGRHT